MALNWYPRACPVCRGDMYDDTIEAGWVCCMMCARSFQAKDLLEVQRALRSRAATPRTA